MIDYIVKNAKVRLYMYTGMDKEYTGQYLKLNILAKRTECVVEKSTLAQRLTCGISQSTVFCWDSVMQCLSTPEKRGNHGSYVYRDKDRNDAMKEVDLEFINLMMSMPVNDSKPLIIQSKKI